MVLPALALGAFATAGALGTLHSGIRYAETMRYWSDYYKNTGYRPRYRARAGYYDYLNVASSGLRSAGSFYSYYNW